MLMTSNETESDSASKMRMDHLSFWQRHFVRSLMIQSELALL
jgi:hypothetical protein